MPTLTEKHTRFEARTPKLHSVLSFPSLSRFLQDKIDNMHTPQTSDERLADLSLRLPEEIYQLSIAIAQHNTSPTTREQIPILTGDRYQEFSIFFRPHTAKQSSKQLRNFLRYAFVTQESDQSIATFFNNLTILLQSIVATDGSKVLIVTVETTNPKTTSKELLVLRFQTKTKVKIQTASELFARMQNNNMISTFIIECLMALAESINKLEPYKP